MDVKSKILHSLEDHPKGLTISELAKEIHVSRITINSHLQFLLGCGEIIQRKVGIAKLHYLPKYYQVKE